MARVHELLSPEDPSLAEGRALIWAAILADPKPAVRLDFKYKNRWFSALARPHGALEFRYRTNAKDLPVKPELELELIKFLAG